MLGEDNVKKRKTVTPNFISLSVRVGNR